MRSSLISLLVLCLTLLIGVAHVEAQASAGRVGCAVEGGGEVDADALCRALGRRLNRPVLRVDDARTVKHGRAVQIIGLDVEWIVAWLRNGEVDAYTRISRDFSRGREAEMIARASRALLNKRRAPKKPCVELRRKQRPNMHMDLAYPWESLKKCTRETPDVVDPWWSVKS